RQNGVSLWRTAWSHRRSSKTTQFGNQLPRLHGRPRLLSFCASTTLLICEIYYVAPMRSQAGIGLRFWNFSIFGSSNHTRWRWTFRKASNGRGGALAERPTLLSIASTSTGIRRFGRKRPSYGRVKTSRDALGPMLSWMQRSPDWRARSNRERLL